MRNAPNDTVTGAVHEITAASREMFQAGERMTANLEELEKRVEHATDWQARLGERPWLLIGGALLGGFLLSRLVR